MLEGILDAEASAQSVLRLCGLAHYVGSVDSNATTAIRVELFKELINNNKTSDWAVANQSKIQELGFGRLLRAMEEAWVKLKPLSPKFGNGRESRNGLTSLTVTLYYAIWNFYYCS